MKKIRKAYKIAENFFWFLLVAPFYVKIKKYKIPQLAMLLVNFFVLFSVILFIMGIVFGKIDGNDLKWFEEIEKDPFIVFSKPFGLALIILSLYYLYATIKNLWDGKEIKKFLLDTNWKNEEYEKLKLQEKKEKEKMLLEWKLLAKSFLAYYLIFFIPVLICAQILLKSWDETLGLIIFIGVIFTALGSALAIAVHKYAKNFFNPVCGTVENFKKRNGYYPKTKYHAYAELGLRAIRAYAGFYIIVIPFSGVYENNITLAGVVLLCVGNMIVSTSLIKKARVNPDQK